MPPGDSLFKKGMSRFVEVDVSLEDEVVASVNASVAAKTPAEACGGLGLDAALADSCAGDITMTGDYSYVEVYKEAQKMSDEAAKDREALKRFDTVPRKKTKKAKIESIETAPPQGVAHHLQRRSWWQALMP